MIIHWYAHEGQEGHPGLTRFGFASPANDIERLHQCLTEVDLGDYSTAPWGRVIEYTRTLTPDEIALVLKADILSTDGHPYASYPRDPRLFPVDPSRQMR